ncbi:mucin-4 [Drosophila tropicalis]|uniref:mucin-4 n=1 Tax=Drosophila tropicalis TaxID=46794 RepID=UPI0035ABBFB5
MVHSMIDRQIKMDFAGWWFLGSDATRSIWSSSSLASGLSVRLILSSLALALLLTTSIAASASSLPSQPAEHLVPPPLPTAQRLRHSGASVAVLPPETGFMTRVARWFGLAGGGQSATQAQSPSLRDQQLSPSSTSYAYPKPVTNFNAGGKPCGLCNKYPWVPMVGQQQQQQHQQQLHSTNDLANWKGPLAQASSQHRQRAVQFRPPPSQSVFLPMAGPNPALSHVAIPPLYSAQPFRPIFQPVNSQQQPLENVAAQSELRPVPAVTTNRPYASPTQVDNSNGFEIIKSHQLTDFVTSVEYPATFVQSHAIDLGTTSVQNNHRPQETNGDDGGAGGEKDETISTVRYQLEDLASGSVHQHLPASRLLTELGHFADSQTTTVIPPADNYPAASSQQQLQQEEEQQLYYAEQYVEQEQQEQEQESETSLPYTTTTEQSPAPFINHHHHQEHHHRDRETPKRLLDSPIKHARLAGEARPFTRDPAELNFRLSQLAPTVASEVATEVPTPTSTYGAIDASGQFAGMSPPLPPNAYSNPQQVIIPYTTKQKPRPFEPWTKVNDVDPQEQQESKLTAASVTPPTLPTRRTTKYLTKILATNLRELLKRERDGTKRRPNGLNIGVDISRLQHNIDGWTEQEYNSLSHRPSTPTIRGRSKHIPTEYLTTTTTTPAPPVTSQLIRQSKTTRGGGFELASSLPATSPNAGDLSTSINNLEHLHILGEKLPKRFHPVDDNHLQFDYYAAHHQDRSKSTTTPVPSTSAPAPTSSSLRLTSEEGVTPLYDRTTPAPMELWKQAKVAILPQTNEKVYVVTPQPPARHQARYHHVSEAEDHHEASASASAPRPVYQTPAPRFSRMRPTPGAAVMPTTSSQLHNYTPDIFGLMGLSSYVPAEPVEIIDGNSKVINIVTPAPLVSALQQPTSKPTISPSPR